MNRRVSVPKPCAANWEIMPGSEQLRHCSACERTVYNFSEMTSAEVEHALTQSAERICARIVQRTNGTIETLANNGKWKMPSAAPGIARAALTALLSAGLPHFSNATPLRNAALVQIEPAKAADGLTIRVEDESEAMFPNADVTIVNEKTQARIEANTDANGMLRMTDLPAGSYVITVSSPFFVPQTLTDVAVPAAAPLKVRLKVRALMGEVVVVSPELTHSPTTEILSEPISITNPPHQDSPIRRFFRKLAHLFS